MEPRFGDILDDTNDDGLLRNLHRMSSLGYMHLEGLTEQPPKEVEALKRVYQEEQPKIIGPFRIWRNPDSRLSRLARQHMHQGGVTLVYLGKQANRHFLEPRVVCFNGDVEEAQTFVIGTSNDKKSGLVVLFRPLDQELRSDNGFLEIYSGSFEWSECQLRESFQQNSNISLVESEWHLITVGHHQALVIHAGTLVRFRPSQSPCKFVCMGYSNHQSDFTREDVEFEKFVAPFLQRVPVIERERILSAQKMGPLGRPVEEQNLRMRRKSNRSSQDTPHHWFHGEARLPFTTMADDALSKSEEDAITRFFRAFQTEQEPLILFLSGDRLEDVFEDYPQNSAGPLSLDRKATNCDRLRYLLNVQDITDDFFMENPDFYTGKENSKFWDNLSNPGFRRNGAQAAFATEHGYDVEKTRLAISKGGKVEVITSEHQNPELAAFLLLLVNSLEQISYRGARCFSSRLQQECPRILEASQAIRGKWKLYRRNYRMLAGSHRNSLGPGTELMR
ncbi:hypothetical protein BBP40_003103 [Aspergillus hancockii]|nr:hypothetical protein BBP40_003103 [Aspergillus hancockii]